MVPQLSLSLKVKSFLTEKTNAITSYQAPLLANFLSFELSLNIYLYVKIQFQIEYEGSKHEIRNLQEEVDVLDLQVKEQTNLKKIAEKQLEEALESLQAEREQR